MMNDYPSQRMETLKRKWQSGQIDTMGASTSRSSSVSSFGCSLVHNSSSSQHSGSDKFKCFLGLQEDDLVSSMEPAEPAAVTVMLEGRSICQGTINLHSHGSYDSLAKALRKMFAGSNGDAEAAGSGSDDVDLSNAVPGHLVAYEDAENDLLLAGDLDWKHFVRVAKRIRILPVKAKSRKGHWVN